MNCLGFGFLCDPLRPLRFRAVSMPAPTKTILAQHLPAPQQKKSFVTKTVDAESKQSESAPHRRARTAHGAIRVHQEKSGQSVIKAFRVRRENPILRDKPGSLLNREGSAEFRMQPPP